ncbi:3685_t:CDS:2, partial [Scutellospora calospora]
RGRRYPVPPQFYEYDDDDNEEFKIRDIKPRNLLPLLLAEATNSAQSARSVESNITKTLND